MRYPPIAPPLSRRSSSTPAASRRAGAAAGASTGGSGRAPSRVRIRRTPPATRSGRWTRIQSGTRFTSWWPNFALWDLLMRFGSPSVIGGAPENMAIWWRTTAELMPRPR